MTENKRYIVKGSDDFFLHIEDITLTEDKHEGTIDNIYQVVDRLNEQEEKIQELKQRNQRQYKRLKQIREEQIETILKLKRKIKELTTQLQTEEDDVCIKCKHHYLTKKDPLRDAISNGEIVPFSSPLINIEPYYISKCKKGHVECSKEDIRYCEDFELTEDDENE